MLLQETHSVEADENFWCNLLGEKIILCHGTNKSARVAFPFKNFHNNIETHRKDNQGQWLICVLKVGNRFLILCNFYCYNSVAQNELILTDIT